VSIYDDSFTWAVNEEIVGTETFERDIPENSGLSDTAITAAYRAETSIEVYEDGSLVARDTDSNGNAIVKYWDKLRPGLVGIVSRRGRMTVSVRASALLRPPGKSWPDPLVQSRRQAV
jgi:hypothetical protein